MPALRSSRTDPTTALKAGGRSLTDASGFSFQRLLVIGQVAVSLVLIVGALLFVRSFRNVTSVDLGMSIDHLYVAVAGFNRPNITPEASQQMRQALLERVQAMPEVRSAATTTLIPLSGMSWTHGIRIPVCARRPQRAVEVHVDQPGLLRDRGDDGASRTRLRHARHGLRARRDARQRDVRPPVSGSGDRHRHRRADRRGAGVPALDREVIGIVRDAKYGGIKDDVPAWAFVPASQHPAPQPWAFLMIRSTASLAALTPSLTRAYADAGATSDTVVWPMTDQVHDSLIRDRLMSWLSGFFGVLAGLLSAIGLYGVMAYAAARRSNEIAIRMALGAGPGDVLRMMLGQASRLVLIGVAIGIAVALALGRSVQALLFGIVPHDFTTIAVAALALLAIGLTAAYVPTARAARVSPLEGLRAE